MSSLIKRSAVHRLARERVDKADVGITRVSRVFIEAMIDDAETLLVNRLTSAIDAHIAAPKRGRKRRTLGAYGWKEAQGRLI